jgi:hypothetical protein
LEACHIKVSTSKSERTTAVPMPIEPGFGALLQWPLQGPVMEKESTATIGAHPSLCQLIGSNWPTSSMGLTKVATPTTLRSMHPRQ